MNKTQNTSINSYITGFIISLILTIIPYQLVVHQVLNRNVLVPVVVLCAIIQLLVQLKFFLHLNFRPSGRDNLVTFLFTVVIVLIVVFGSIWIMHDLNYYMMDPIMEQHHLQMKE